MKKKKPSPGGLVDRAIARIEEESKQQRRTAKEAEFLDVSAKKLTKAREEFNAGGRRRGVDAMVTSVMAEMRQRYGDGAVAGATDPYLLVGLPLPSFALEWLLGNNVLPLSRSINLTGPPATYKSAFLYEIFRWFHVCNGIGMLADTEKKFSDDYLASIIGPVVEEFLLLFRGDDMDQWMRQAQDTLGALKDKMDGTPKSPGPGRITPMAMGVDSLVGQLSNETSEKVRKDGAVGRSHAVEAAALMRFVTELASSISDWPFTVVTINHFKPKKNARTGRDQDHQPGGWAPQYFRSIDIRMSKAEAHRQDSAHRKCRVLIMKVIKNSCADDNRSIMTRVLWWHEPDAQGVARQVTRWDWNWALLHILLKDDHPEKVKKALAEMLGLHVKSRSGDGRVWSRKMGVSKEEPITFSEMGAKIQANQDLLIKLRNLFGITVRPIFNPAIDYRFQQNMQHRLTGAVKTAGPKKGKKSKKTQSQAAEPEED